MALIVNEDTINGTVFRDSLILDISNHSLLGYFPFKQINFLHLQVVVWHYILPLICFIGVLTNIVNIVVYSNQSQLKNSIYRYMLLHSICALFHVFISFLYFFNKNDILGMGYFKKRSYFYKFFEMYFFISITTLLSLFLILVELTISLKRMLIVLNTTTNTNSSTNQNNTTLPLTNDSKSSNNEGVPNTSPGNYLFRFMIFPENKEINEISSWAALQNLYSAISRIPNSGSWKKLMKTG